MDENRDSWCAIEKSEQHTLLSDTEELEVGGDLFALASRASHLDAQKVSLLLPVQVTL